METIIQSALMEGQQSLWVVLIVFATGLLTSLTPCVYPMLPITVSVISKHAQTKKHAISLSLVYVFGLSLVYAGLGVLAASTGKLFGSVASHPITLIIVATFCVLMALWILGWLTMPSFSVFSKKEPKKKSEKATSNYLTIFIAGCISGLVMAPCTSPVLGMLLMYVASEGDLVWAASLMFTFALGMSALLVIAGSFSGFLTLLPPSGHWLNAVKWIMAIPMLGAAVYLLIQVST